jgi:hypothetical protein
VPVARGQTPHVDPPEFDLIDATIRQAIFAQFNPKTFLGARNLAVVAFLSDTGVRQEELCLVKDVGRPRQSAGPRLRPQDAQSAPARRAVFERDRVNPGSLRCAARAVSFRPQSPPITARS